MKLFGTISLTLFTVVLSALFISNCGTNTNSGGERDFLLFAGNDGSGGATYEENYELWSCDTEDNVTLIKDINPGPDGSLNLDVDTFSLGYSIKYNGELYFSADDGSRGTELWKTSGTAVGTTLVADINPDTGHSSPWDLMVHNGELYFGADDGSRGRELWKTNGTAVGTTFVADMNPDTGGSYAYPLTVHNGELYFGADDGSRGNELWKTNGTAVGTTLVADINPGSGGSGLRNLMVFNGELYFVAYHRDHAYEIWKTDGTRQGTMMVMDLWPGGGDGCYVAPL